MWVQYGYYTKLVPGIGIEYKYRRSKSRGRGLFGLLVGHAICTYAQILRTQS